MKYIFIFLFLGSSLLFGVDNNPFLGIFNYLIGNIGKLIALIGFVGTFIIYMMTHKGEVLIIGIVLSLLSGGMVGISTIFFKEGPTFNLSIIFLYLLQFLVIFAILLSLDLFLKKRLENKLNKLKEDINYL